VPALSLAAVLASSFAVGLTLGLASPLVALSLAARGHDSLTVGLTAAVYSLSILAAAVGVPRLMHRVGALPVLLGGLLLGALSLALMPVFDALAAWFLLRIAMGIGTALDWVVSETWVNSLASEARRGRTVGLYATVWGAGIAGGPILLAVVGPEGPVPFLAGAGLLLLAGIPVIAARRHIPRLAGEKMPGGLLAVAPRAPLAIATGLLSGFGEGAVFALLPVFGLGIGLAPAAAAGLTSAFAAGGILLQPVVGWLADRVDRAILLLAATAVSITCMALVPVAAGDPSTLWPLVFLWGGTVAGYYTLGLVQLGQRFTGGDLATANTGFIIAYTGGMAIGPTVAGAGMNAFGHGGLIVVLIAAGALFAGGVALALRPRQAT
jgi:MFS family permease